ncbi:preprotein translocase subunit SecG [Rhodobacter capsulatus]|uniref:preprotein translocase subunit SecG n=1 Tax=Rhodobacter capsulatus TaxID=1061 RepID=UPI0003D3854B|nr:preprotein translocase subunit SecG [Rhodobacter capsulatus]ETD82445.1 preprotein translocase subunit SecG [Rhodobacter capsulatus YW1]ETD89587.1 preprotein translocase subunit SecG [Rhodobacter capsulatus YW2]
MENVQNVILVVHLVLALLLIGVVLLQRSEGGGLGMGGGGGGGVMTGRQAANALTKLTWIFAIGFLATSITLTVFSARAGKEASVVDTTPAEAPAAPDSTGTSPLISAPPPSTDEPVVPPVTPPAATEAPAEAPAATETPAPEAPASN